MGAENELPEVETQEVDYVVEPAAAPASPPLPFLIVDRVWCKVLLTVGLTYVFTHVSYNLCATLVEIDEDPSEGGYFPALGFLVGLGFGYFKAPIMSGYFCASMARIESLPYCYPWDFIMFEFFIACSIIIPLLHLLRMFALEEGGFLYTLEVFLEAAVVVMFGSVWPSLVYYWRHPGVGTRQCLYEWQKRLPYYGTYVQKVFKFLVERQKTRLAMGKSWPLNYVTTPWGADCNTEHQQIKEDGTPAIAV